jgi:hypothetical protein
MNIHSYTYGKDRALLVCWNDTARQVSTAPLAIPKGWIIQFLDCTGEAVRLSANMPQAVYRQFKKRLMQGACTHVQVFTRKCGKLVKVDSKRFFALCNER